MRRAIGIVTLGTVALALVGQAAGIRPNFSDSAPVGLWITRPITTPLQRDMMVGVCPPSTVPLVKLFAENGTLPYGNCPESRVALLLKPVRALPGDIVGIKKGNSVTVNGEPIPNSSASDSFQSWPDGEYTVQPGEVWVFSSYSPKSFDSRYFGPVKIKDIQSLVFPIMVTE